MNIGLCVIKMNDAVCFDHGVDGEGRSGFVLTVGAVAAMHDERFGDHPASKVFAGATSFSGV